MAKNLRKRNLLLGHLSREPVKTLVQTLSACGTGGLDVPVALSEGIQSELVGDLCGVHCVGQILLVGKHKEHSVSELVLIEHSVELVSRLSNTIPIVRVDHKDESLCVLEVVAPEGSDLVLTADIPHRKVDVLVLDSLDVESCSKITHFSTKDVN